MSRAAAMIVGLFLAAAAVIAGVVYATRPRLQKKSSAAGLGLTVASGCTPEKLQAGFEAAIAAGIEGGKAYASGGASAAQSGGGSTGTGAGGGGAQSLQGVIDFASGPCGAKLEKKLRMALAGAEPRVREAARKILLQVDANRRKTQDVVTLGPQRRAVKKRIKKLLGR